MNTLFLDATKGMPVPTIPVWFMRQAGRSLPGYRKLRETYDVLTLTRTPELAAETSAEPVKLLGVDAAILFADIMLLPIALGIELQIQDGVGPVIKNPLLPKKATARFDTFSPESVQFLGDTIGILKNSLTVPVIGFGGAPFTLLSYLIEGKPSKTWHATKRFMIEEEEEWHILMDTLARALIPYLTLQVEAGASALQIFDSWVGCLSPEQYRRYVLPHMRFIFAELTKTGVPTIHFGTNTAHLLADFADVEASVIGVDWRITLADAKKVVGGKSLQGNLDPAYLLASWDTLTQEVDRTLAGIDPKKGYIFNLGHGMIPEADDRVVKKLVEYVHQK